LLSFTTPIRLINKLIKQLLAEQNGTAIINKFNDISRSLKISNPPAMMIEVKNKLSSDHSISQASIKASSSCVSSSKPIDTNNSKLLVSVKYEDTKMSNF